MESGIESGIYAIINTVNGHQYVGSAISFKHRWEVHVSQLRRGKHHSPYLQRAWRLYGAAAFRFEVLEYVASPADLVSSEQRWIDRLHPAYNVAPTAGSMLGYRHRSETLPKLGAAWIGWKHTPEERWKIGAGNRGIPKSAEVRAKLRAAHLGKKRGPLSPEARMRRLAVVQSPEYRAKMSAVKKGVPHSREHVEKVAAAWRGRHHSPDTRAKLSAARKGKPLSEERRAQLREIMNRPEVRAKLSAAKKGRPLSEEQRAQRREVMNRPEVRAKISAAKRGKPLSEKARAAVQAAKNRPEVRAKISAANKGRVLSDAWKAKIAAGVSAGQKRRWAARKAATAAGKPAQLSLFGEERHGRLRHSILATQARQWEGAAMSQARFLVGHDSQEG